MSVRRLAPDAVQPADFAFTPANENFVAATIAKFPVGRQASAVIPLLWRAQEQHDYWLPKAAIEHVAERLGMSVIRVLEVATFYTMFNLAPVGRHFVQLCGTTPCRLRGAADIIKICEERIGPQKHVSSDGKFSWLEVECLGACCNAPMVQINNDVYEDLTEENFRKLLDDLAAGRPVKTGSQTGRRSSEPEGAVKTLTDGALYDGSAVGNWRVAFDERQKKAAEAKAAAAAAAAAQAATAVPTPTPAARPATAAVTAAAAPARPPTAGPTNALQDTPAAGATAVAATGAARPVADPSRDDDGGPEAAPATLAAARNGQPDDLGLIWGVGPKMEALLQSMGFFHFDQIAAWTDENLRWVDRRLEGFKGRARRDDWIGQSKKLATGWRPRSRLGDKPNS
jgi:NADH-quinone oxidoreductase subunit E